MSDPVIARSDGPAEPTNKFDAALLLAEVDALVASGRGWNAWIAAHPVKVSRARMELLRREGAARRSRGSRGEEGPGNDDVLIAEYDEVDQDELMSEPIPAAKIRYVCAECEDSGEVVPDAFGPGEPWPKYVAKVAEFCLARGLPEHVSPMIHPLPCPRCRAEEHAVACREMLSR